MTKKLPHPISRDDFDKLLEGAKKMRDEFKNKKTKKLSARGVRYNQYIISMCLGFGAGLRISEIIGYKTKDYKYVKKEDNGK